MRHQTARVLRELFLVACCLAMGCSGFTGPRDVSNEDPSVKIPEIRKAVDKSDNTVVSQLVNDLDSDDPAVRFYAIQGLFRLTGERFDYQWKETDRSARGVSLKRWRAFAGLLPVVTAQSTTAASQTAD